MRNTLTMAASVLALGCGGAPPAARHSAGTSGSGASTGTTAAQVTTGNSNGRVMGSTTSTTTATSTTSTSSNSSSSGASSTSGSGSVSTSGSSGASSASTIASSGSSGSSGGQCFGNGTFPGGGIPCCSGYTDGSGYCADPPASSSTTGGGTSTTGTTGTTSTGGSSGSTGASCTQACYSARGYHCENGVCVLNGSSGPIQVTLKWDTSLQAGGVRAREDLDLHMIDPTGCEIFYANRTCGTGTLDLDSNAGCSHTENPGSFGNDTENIIFNGTPAHGTYQVFANFYEGNCDGTSDPDPFTYQATVRYAGQTHVIQGVFHQSDANHNTHSGPGWAHILDFTY